MDPRFRQLRENVRIAQSNLQTHEHALATALAQCGHSWTEPKYDPIVREPYTIPGDRPGTMGIDWRGPTYVERKETPRWTRECKICGKVAETGQVVQILTQKPKF